MSYTCFTVDVQEKIAHIVLNRPEKRNSMNAAFWDELPAIVRDIDRNAKARVIVVSSTGPHFSAGLDIAEMLMGDSTDDVDQKTKDHQAGLEFYQLVNYLQDSFNALENCRVPVLAAIQGGCVGGAVDLATACDMRYGTEDSYFSIAETTIGMTADVGTFPRLAKLMPEGMVRELAYTGRKFTANEALRLGLMNAVYADHDSMIEGVMGVAAQIASNAPSAVYGCKKMLNYARDHTIADSLDYVAVWNMKMLQMDQMMEAISARAEKRPGNYIELPKIAQTTR